MPNKKPVMLLAGLWVVPYIWEKWTTALSKAGYTSDCLRYGENFCHFHKSLNEYIELIIRRCYSIQEDSGQFPIIFGHSMGGLVAQAVATRIAIPKVVLVCSAAPGDISNLSWPVVKRMLPYIPAIISGSQFCPSNKHSRELIFNECVGLMGHYGLAKSSGKIVRQAIIGSVKLPNLNCPCLVVAGNRDRMIPISVQRKLAQKHDANLVTGSYGHMPMLEDKDEALIKLIISWLSQTS